jgi:hypothetical protein
LIVLLCSTPTPAGWRAQVVTAWCDPVRRLLICFNGYECKEPERGKFTLAFASLKSAMAFAVTAQENLMHLDYPDILLQIEECQEVRFAAQLRDRILQARARGEH